MSSESRSQGEPSAGRRPARKRDVSELYPRYFRLDDMTRLLGIQKTCIYSLVRRGQLPAPLKLGITPVWDEEELREFLRNSAER